MIKQVEKIVSPKLRVGTKYIIRENYFDTLDTANKVYFLGLLFADGSNNPEKYKVGLSLSGKENEKLLLQLLKELYLNKTNLYVRKLSLVNKNYKDAYKFTICNKHISLRLNELGIIKNKSNKIIFPKYIANSLLSHFIRGYFDGDGHIGWQKNRPKANCNVTSSVYFCKELKRLLKLNLNINSCLTFRHKNNTQNATLVISGNQQILEFLDWLYTGKTLYMKSKHAKYKKIKNIVKKTNRKRYNVK